MAFLLLAVFTVGIAYLISVLLINLFIKFISMTKENKVHDVVGRNFKPYERFYENVLSGDKALKKSAVTRLAITLSFVLLFYFMADGSFFRFFIMIAIYWFIYKKVTK